MLSFDSEIHLVCKAQLAFLLTNNISIAIFFKYVDFADVSFLKFAAKLSEHTRINNHLINLVDDQKLSYESIYSLDSVKLKMLKIYIKINLANNFIQTSKLLTRAIIFFVWKSNSSFPLCVNNQRLNNFIIKN